MEPNMGFVLSWLSKYKEKEKKLWSIDSPVEFL